LTVKIVVDSALNIPQEILANLDISVVPVNIVIDGRTYREGVDATRSELVTLIGESKQLSTSQPSPGDFLTVYDKLGGEVVSIHITSRSSGTYQSATLAATMTTTAKVSTFDSEQAALGGGWQAIAGALRAKQGGTVAEVLQVVERARAEVATFLTVPTLKYLSRSGRVTLAKALIASLLSVKPVMGINSGVVEVVAKSRSMSGSLKEMVSLIKEKHGQRSLAVAIMHAEAPELAIELSNLAKAELKVAQLFTTDLTASLVVHGGPGTVTISVIPAEYVSELTLQ